MSKESIGDLSGTGLMQLNDEFYFMDLHGGAVVGFEKTVVKKGQPARVKFDRAKRGNFVPWGDDNLFPELVRETVQKSTILAPQLPKIANRIYAGGIQWGTLEWDAATRTEVYNPSVMYSDKGKKYRTFLRANDYESTIWEIIYALKVFQQTWVEVILHNNKKDVYRVKHHQPRYCRHGWQNSSGVIEETLVYGDWKKDPRGQGARSVFTVDPTFDIVGQIRDSKRQNIMIPLRMPDVLSDYYALAPWDAARQSKWMSVTEEIPKLKAAIMKNQISPKYHIRISREYWEYKHPTWLSMENKERKTIWEAFQTEIKTALAGSDNAGKALMSMTHKNPSTGKDIEGVIIQPLALEFKDGQYLETSSEASTHIFSSLGEDPALSNIIPGDKSLGGSGSDKKVAWDIAYALDRPIQDLSLKVWNIVRELNGYPDDWVHRYRNAMQARLYSASGTPINKPEP
ncbi:MAG: hypothetical protein ACPG5W_03820 [Flavobacteriales bacterium]